LSVKLKHGDFSGLAEDYAKFRPSYAPQVAAAIIGYVGRDAGSVDAADIGAGTGIWTRMLAAHRLRSVVAVEPNDEMREQGIQTSRGVPIAWRKGSAEATGLPDGSTELISMASSFHWADFDKACDEFHRILRPGGIFVALWNPRFIEASPLLLDIEAQITLLKADIRRVSSGRSGFTERLSEMLSAKPQFGEVLYLEGRHSLHQTPIPFAIRSPILIDRLNGPCDGNLPILVKVSYPHGFISHQYPWIWRVVYFTRMARIRAWSVRTKAVRFEDLHCNTEKTLCTLVRWLGLPFHTSLLESTFNGTSYVVECTGKVWSGPRLEQAERHSRNISFVDRALLFALFYDDCETWNYSYPKIFSSSLVRGITCMLLLLIPTKMEIIAASPVIKLQVLPSLASGNLRMAVNQVARIIYYRLAMISIVATECFRRLRTKKYSCDLSADPTRFVSG
jgi:SAM-dependent methyltransferase